jgi:SAM-dependent methyltransferase
MFYRTWESIKLRGMKRTLQSAASILEDWAYDKTRGTDTMNRIAQAELKLQHEAKASAHPYIPTRGRAFRKLFDTLKFPPGSVFLDYGSGKGKVLFLAAEYGFKRIVGVEYAPELNDVALANIKKLPREKAERIVSVVGDARTYEVEDDVNVFYFFNPFENDVLLASIGQIRKSLDRKPRKIWVIYFDPWFTDSFTRGLGVRKTRDFVYGGYEVVVLENDAPA